MFVNFDKPSAANAKFNPNFTYFSPREETLIKDACSQTQNVSRSVLKGLTMGGGFDNEVSARVNEWFGNSSFKDVVEGAKKMDNFIQSGKVTFVDRRHKSETIIRDPRNPARDRVIPMEACDYAYVKNLPDYRSSGVAHVGSGMRLYLGERFFHQSKSTVDRTATIYHEIAHKILALGDIKYGPANCRQLARIQPSQAIKNPDNWCYFATSFVHRWP